VEIVKEHIDDNKCKGDSFALLEWLLETYLLIYG
jgi:hypothetical protein